MEEKVCSFFGHRKIADSEALRQRIQNAIVDLIENYGVNVFLFGSRSDFDSLCHAIVTELKEEYPHIQRRAYTCRSETCTLEKRNGSGHGCSADVCCAAFGSRMVGRRTGVWS